MTAKKIGIVVAVLVGVALFFLFNLQQYLTLDMLKANREALVRYYAVHRIPLTLAFVLLYVVQTALSLPGATIFSLAAGVIFGPFMGTLYACLSATLGAVLAFLFTRYVFRDAVQNRIGSRLEGMNRELELRGFNYLLFLRLVPIFPFFLINLAAGLTRMPLETFISGTLVGIIPGGFVYVNAGASLASINSVADIFSTQVIGSFSLIGFLALVPALYMKIKQSREQKDEPRQEP